MNRTSALLLLAALPGLTVRATANDDQGGPQVSGDYRVVITQTCVRTPFQLPPANGFDPATRQLLVAGEALTATGSGVLRFEDDGTVQVLEGVQTEASVAQVAPGQAPVAPPAQFTCRGPYTVQDRKVSFTISCDVAVPQPGVAVTVGPQVFEGYVDQNKQTINLLSIAGGIQTITVSVAGNAVQQRQRVCTQYAQATR